MDNSDKLKLNRFFESSSIVERFICSAISYTSKEVAIGLYEQLDDKTAYIFAKNNLVDPIVGRYLIDKYGEKNIPKRWVVSYRKTAKRISAYLSELDRVAKLFDEENIPLIALKNSGIARVIYPYYGLVPMGDVDTLVRRSDFINAHKILVQNGYKIAAPNQYNLADVDVGYRKGSSEYTTTLSNGQQLWFELQWRPVEGKFLRPDQEPNTDDLIDRSISVDGTDLRILSPEDNLLQVCLHTAKHSYVRAPGFRLHLDVDRIVNGQVIDWNLFLEYVLRHKVKIPVYFSLVIPQVLFNTPIPLDILEKIKPAPLKKHVLSSWIKKAGLFNPHEKKFGKVEYILWNAFLYDTIGGLLRAIFPDVAWLRDKYNLTKIYHLPIAYIRHFRDLALNKMGT